MSSPTQRTLKWLKDRGFRAAITERWNAYARVRVDLFGFIDLVALHENTTGVLAIQTTSGSNVAARITKIRGIPESELWLETGNAIWVIGWRKLVAYNDKGLKLKRKQWVPRIVVLTKDSQEGLDVSKYGYTLPSSTKYECVYCGAVHHWKFQKCSRCKEKNPNVKVESSFTAMVHAVHGTPGSEMKRYLLLCTLRENPYLIRILRLAFDNTDLGFTSDDVKRAKLSDIQYTCEEILADRIKNRITSKVAASRWKSMVRDIGDPFKEVLNNLLDKKIKLGLNVKGINRVFRKLGEREIEED